MNGFIVHDQQKHIIDILANMMNSHRYQEKGETMMENTFTHAEQNNQQLWDELAPIHVKSYQEVNMLKER